MSKETWGLQFVKVDVKNNEFVTLLIIKGVSESYAREVLDRIKSEFVENKGEPDCVIDLLDEDDSIVDDFAATFNQAQSIASLLGFSFEEANLNDSNL